MAKTNLGSMSVEQLLQLRDDVGKEPKRWPRLFEQIFRVDKWSLCRG